jgi:hypothetical protein
MNNYLKAILWLSGQDIVELIPWMREHKGDRERTALVQHDFWCGIFQDRDCDCKPDIFILGEQYDYPKEILG